MEIHKKQSFEDLRIFAEARELANKICALAKTGALSRDYFLADQMRRAALSIVSNIAEGFERQSNAEFVRFLYMAKGSCGELRAQLLIVLDQKLIKESDHNALRDRCVKISVGIFRLIEYLKGKRQARKEVSA